MIKLRGRYYYGSRKSLKGWEFDVGNFHILAAQPNFRRYIVYSGTPNLKDMEKELRKLAKDYELKCTSVLKTQDPFYKFKKYYQVFLIKEGKNTLEANLEEIQSKPLKAITYKGKIALALRVNRPYKKSNSFSVDINKYLRPKHKSILKSLDDILFKEEK